VTVAPDWKDLLARAAQGHIASTARLISALEARLPGREDALPGIYSAGGQAHVIGITGAPGAGKSTLVAALVMELRRRGQRVGVVAVDPSSTLSGGAILGDRIRMQQHALDPGVYVRSMSTRGTLGGLSRATVDAVAVLDAAGWPVVIVETIGVGQDEVDIIRIAQTTAIVSVPGLGDDIQAIKAGLLEVGDIHVVNKADRPDANKTISDLLHNLTLRRQFHDTSAADWAVPVMPTIALDGTGIREVADAFAAHREHLAASGELRSRERATAAARIRNVAKDLLIERIEDPTVGAAFEELVDAVAARRLDPETAARTLIGAAVETRRR
jgi:LAO/AO transport system kinase